MNLQRDARRPVALVTGASRGIGRASAVALAGAGFDVAVSARTLVDGSARLEDQSDVVVPGGLDTTVSAIEAAGGAGLAVQMDVLDRASVLACAATTLAHFGRIDLLVNNAIFQGDVAMTEFVDLEPDALLPLFEGNLFAQLALTQAVLPGMRERGDGTVMNMISHAATNDPPGRIGSGGWGVGYAMTKAALYRVAPALQVELGHEGLRFHNIDPGYVVTERAQVRKVARGFDDDRAARPDVIGAAVAWLATTDEAGEYAGQVVYAQREVATRALVPGWPARSPA